MQSFCKYIFHFSLLILVYPIWYFVQHAPKTDFISIDIISVWYFAVIYFILVPWASIQLLIFTQLFKLWFPLIKLHVFPEKLSLCNTNKSLLQSSLQNVWDKNHLSGYYLFGKYFQEQVANYSNLFFNFIVSFLFFCLASYTSLPKQHHLNHRFSPCYTLSFFWSNRFFLCHSQKMTQIWHEFFFTYLSV